MAVLPTVDIDPITGKPRTAAPDMLAPATTGLVTPPPATGGNLPLMTDPNAVVPLTTDAGNTAVLAKAQTQVLNQPQSTLMPTVVQKTSDLLANPMPGLDPTGYKQAQIDAFNNARAKSIEAYRQKSADTANTGTTGRNMLDLLLQSDVDRSTMGSQIDYDLAQKQQDAAIKALAEGRATSTQESNMFTQGLSNLGAVRGMAEGEAGRVSTEKISYADLDAKESQFSRTLAQSGKQFSSELEFKKYAIDAGLSGEEAARVWQADQNATTRAFTASESVLDRAGKLDFLKADQAGQGVLATLKGEIDAGNLLTANNFKAAEAVLDRAQATALQAGDLVAQKEIINLKDQLAVTAATAQQTYDTAERVATQSWKTDERVSDQNAALQTQWIDQNFKTAMQNNDIALQVTLANLKSKHEIQMQTNDMSQQEKTLWLKNEIDTARANGDVIRQQQVIEYQTTQDINKMVEAGRIDDIKAYWEQQNKIALQNNDAVHVAALQKARMDFNEDGIADDVALDQARLALEGRGVDMKEMEAQYDRLATEVKEGRANPSTLSDFVAGVAKKAGVTITPPDAMATANAAQKKYDDMLFQYNLTHGGSVVYKAASTFAWGGKTYKTGEVVTDPATIEYVKTNVAGQLKGELSNTVNAKEFNDFFNSTTYGELTPSEQKAKDNAGYLTDPADIASSLDGDKFIFDKPQTIVRAYAGEADSDVMMKAGTSTSGGGSVVLPPGKYKTVSRTRSIGSNFAGTARDITDTFIVGEDNKEYLVKHVVGKSTGNIVSGLWAG